MSAYLQKNDRHSCIFTVLKIVNNFKCQQINMLHNGFSTNKEGLISAMFSKGLIFAMHVDNFIYKMIETKYSNFCLCGRKVETEACF